MIIRAMSAAIATVVLCAPAYAQSTSKQINTAVATVMSTMQNGDPLPRAKPEEVGLSSDRLNEIGKRLNADIQAGRIPGAVVMIARKGKLAYYETFGFRDKDAGVAMTKDTIFNIASMTKPMVAVAALQLQERGQLLIDDPVSKWFRNYANMKVAELDAKGETITGTVPMRREITLRDLMMHTSGLIYGGRGNTAVHRLYPAGSGVAATQMTSAEFIDKLATLPLLNQPGATWDYGFGLDVLGQVVEQVAKQSLGKYFEANIFKPLGMTDTMFRIPPEKAARYAKALPNDPETGKPQALGLDLSKNVLEFECGGGCLASTAGDYMRFALMLLNKGAYGETRILGRKTAEYMLMNQLGPDVKNLIANADPSREGYGFGLGLAVRTEAARGRMLGSAGDFNWPGASGTNWWADPKEELAVVFMAHSPGPIRWHYRQGVNALVYQAIAD
jgi:CubicO group peptidase (beta-lactamase class C family)